MSVIIGLFIGLIWQFLLAKYCPPYKNFCIWVSTKLDNWIYWYLHPSHAYPNAEQISRIKRPKKLLDRYKILKNENK